MNSTSIDEELQLQSHESDLKALPEEVTDADEWQEHGQKQEAYVEIPLGDNNTPSRLLKNKFDYFSFLPAFLFLPIWLTIALREDLLATSFREFYPLSVDMIFGSLIAGSTPLGGGVVAFPVTACERIGNQIHTIAGT